jgi:hypothetical protein
MEEKKKIGECFESRKMQGGGKTAGSLGRSQGGENTARRLCKTAEKAASMQRCLEIKGMLKEAGTSYKTRYNCKD